jgi:HEAT repeat protein
MRCFRWLLPALLILCSPAFTAEADLPLDVYQKFKNHFDLLYGAGNSLLSGAPVRSKEEIQKDLRADAAANKDVLIRGLKAEKAVQRELAAMALEYCGDKKAAVAALLPLVSSDKDASVRRAAIAVLARLPDAASVDTLIKGLSDDTDSVRGVSATALGNIKDNRAVDPLLSILKDDPQPMVRLQSALALAKIKDSGSLKGLKEALEAEKDERVKMAIAGAMRAAMGGGDDADTSPVPSADEAAGELASLAREMKEVESKLREDRHDQSVQTQGKSIEDKLAALILKLDKG